MCRPNAISIDLTAFAQLTHASNAQTPRDTQTQSHRRRYVLQV